MKFSSIQIRGKGRGKLLGFPTINLDIPKDFKLIEGIYAVKVFIKGQEFLGALHFGPIPTFSERDKTLEVFLVDVSPDDLPKTSGLNIEIETIKYLRAVQNFPDQDALAKQIGADVLETRKLQGTRI